MVDGLQGNKKYKVKVIGACGLYSHATIFYALIVGAIYVIYVTIGGYVGESLLVYIILVSGELFGITNRIN